MSMMFMNPTLISFSSGGLEASFRLHSQGAMAMGSFIPAHPRSIWVNSWGCSSTHKEWFIDVYCCGSHTWKRNLRKSSTFTTNTTTWIRHSLQPRAGPSLNFGSTVSIGCRNRFSNFRQQHTGLREGHIAFDVLQWGLQESSKQVLDRTF